MENSQTATKSIMTIPRRLLVLVYLILPVLLLVVLSDIFYFNSKLLPYMGIEALLLPVFIFIFNLPHIIASFFSFFDREYISYYRKYLFGYLPLLLLGTGLLLSIDFRLGFVLYMIYDIWHGVKQQVGVALILGAKPTWLHKVWTSLAFISASIAYVYILIPDMYPPAFVPFISPVLFIGVLSFFVSMVIMIWKSIPAVRWYIFSVSMLFILSYFFILSGYIFFAFLAIRFVHDVTAYAFYVTHDHNRKKSVGNNWFYKLLTSVPLPTLILTPFFGFLFAYMVRSAVDGLAYGYSIIVLIGMAHFYLESVMWKRGSPHRQYVKVV